MSDIVTITRAEYDVVRAWLEAAEDKAALDAVERGATTLGKDEASADYLSAAFVQLAGEHSIACGAPTPY